MNQVNINTRVLTMHVSRTRLNDHGITLHVGVPRIIGTSSLLDGNIQHTVLIPAGETRSRNAHDQRIPPRPNHLLTGKLKNER